MATNSSGGPQSSDNALPENVTVRVITLAHSDRTENDLYLVLHLDTTVGELKRRIQEGLSQRPPPETQRLLYRGRPLLDNTAALRQVLRQEHRAGDGGASYVLHLVIRGGQANHAPQPTSQPPIPNQPHQHVHLNNPQLGQIQLPQMPAGLPDFAHNMIHNSVHMMQHQMQHQRAVEEANRRARGIHNHINPPANAGLPAAQAHVQPHLQTQNPHTNQRSSSPAQPLPAVQVTQTPQMLGLAMADPPTRPASNPPQPAAQTTRIQETIGPNGERIRTVVNNNSMTVQVAGSSLPNPFERPSSAPNPAQLATADPTNRADGPAPRGIAIAYPMVPHPQMAGFAPVPGRQLPFPIPPNHQVTMPLMPSMPNHGQTMAWLLSSPQGPQGIVFAPGHGFFSSNSPTISVLSQAPSQPLQPTRTVQMNGGQTAPQSNQTPQQQAVRVSTDQNRGNPPPPQPGAQPQPHIQDLARPDAQAQPQAPAQQPANNENDLLQFVINRGWLFLRLYMFVFIFSESGTWRRVIMLSSIIIFCLLPQQNPLTDMFNVTRRHFDRLIGPPPIPQREAAAPVPQGQQPPPQQQNQTRQNGNQPTDATGALQNTNGNLDSATSNDNNRANGNTGPTMPTPEETARRLLAQHQDRRNAHPFLDMLYRIEQGAALFFASLVPGVGERHVQAREEARRIVEADDRRIREEAERQNQNNGENKNASSSVNAVGTSGTTSLATHNVSGAASSSGVDAAGTSNGQQGIRSRNNNAGGDQAS